MIIAFDRTQTVYIVVKSCGSYDVLRVLIVDAERCKVISDFGRRLGLTDTLGLDLMLVSSRCQQDEFKKKLVLSDELIKLN